MRNEKKTYNKLVNMSYKTEESFGTFLMEALMKFSCEYSCSNPFRNGLSKVVELLQGEKQFYEGKQILIQFYIRIPGLKHSP